MPLVRGREACAQRLMRRITTPKGKLTFWPNDGIDVRDYLLSKAPASAIAQAVASECRKDEQVDEIAVNPWFSEDGRTLNIDFLVTDNEGPWKFTLEISQAKATLVSLQAAA